MESPERHRPSLTPPPLYPSPSRGRRRLLPSRPFRFGEHAVDPGPQVAGLELRLQPLAVAGAVEVLGAVDLLALDPHLLHRHPRHPHRRLEHLAHRTRD